MAARRTNLALLALLPTGLATGFLAFAEGGRWAAWAAAGHGAAGLAIVALGPAKSAIARRSLRRRELLPPASAGLALLLTVTILTGFAHQLGVLRSLGPVTTLQVHVATALASIPLFLWHVVARPVRPRRTDLSRRNFLRSTAVVTGWAAAYGALAGAVRLAGLPGASARATGSFEVGSGRPDALPVTQWLFDAPPEVDPATWRLEVWVPGRPERLWSLTELDRMREPVEAVLDCTGGWFSRQRWEGVRLDRLVGPVGGAASIEVRSRTGYGRRFPVAHGPGLWLASRVGGRLLEAGHGFPARIVAPGRRGFWWVKWVDRVSLTGTPWWWQPPFPVH